MQGLENTVKREEVTRTIQKHRSVAHLIYVKVIQEAKTLEKMPTVEEMERVLKLDTIKPIVSNSDDEQRDIDEKAGSFDSWYEKELRRVYEQYEA